MDADPLPEVPEVGKFVRRAWHSSVLLGDHIYIDGGEITQITNGTQVTRTTNVTLTLDISASWTNESINFGSIPRRGPPRLNEEILIPTSNQSSFFVFGGGESVLKGSPSPPTPQLWKFTESSDQWTNVDPDYNSGFSNLTRPLAALTATIEDMTYVLGGLENDASNRVLSPGTGLPIPGIVSFNTSSGVWANTTSPKNLAWHNGYNGILVSVPAFGSVGLLAAAQATSTTNGSPPYDNITIYEPKNKTWHYQTATGELPFARAHACTVGVQGDNGSYEMLVHQCMMKPWASQYISIEN